jgi:hypothetical protein
MESERDKRDVVSEAEWLAAQSERARALGDVERADRLLLLAWMAYDGQALPPDWKD